MAITQVYYELLRQASQQGILPIGGSILELGEANWYSDFPINVILNDVADYVGDEKTKRELEAQLDKPIDKNTYAFDIAKIIYGIFFSHKRIVSIDLHGTSAAKQLDLNQPIDLGETFNVTINNGTAEHVFNVAQVFKTMHDHTAVNGLMIHEGPFTGWFNHGFVNFQPTLFYDLAAANNYEIAGLFCVQHSPAGVIQIESPLTILKAVEEGKVPNNSDLVAFLKKTNDNPFVFPMQGYYAGTVDEKEREAWKARRESE